MGLFSAAANYLGIDIDSHSLKVVELKNEKGRPRLVTYGYFDHPLDYEAKDGSAADLKLTAAMLRETCRKAKVTSHVAISSLPAYSVFSSVITLPELNRKELAAAVRWEAKKVIPMSIDEMNLHWDILPAEAAAAGAGDQAPAAPAGQEHVSFEGLRLLKVVRRKPAGNTRILLTAAPKALVRKYMTLFREAGLSLIALDTEAFALIRSLVGNDAATVMLVDLDFTVTNIMIVQRGIPYLNRSINVGGLTITRAIAAALNISLERAEQLKYDIGMQPAAAAGGSIPATITQALAPVVDEIRYSLNLYRSQGRPPIERVVLTGGSSLLANLPPYLGNLLQLRVFLGDPWARVIYPEELKPALDEIGPRFSVAIGLGMKEIA